MDEQFLRQDNIKIIKVKKDEMLYYKAIDNVMMSDEQHINDKLQFKQRRLFVGKDNEVNSHARPVKRPEYDRKLSNKNAKDYKKNAIKLRKNADGVPLSVQERKDIYSVINNKEVGKDWLEEKHGGFSNRDIINDIKEGKYSHFEKLDNVFRDVFATNCIEGFMKRYNYTAETTINHINIENLAKENEQDFFNPVFRLGLSQMARYQEKNGIENGVYRALDNEIARQIMLRTLTNRLEEKEQEKENYINKKISDGTMNANEANAKFEEACKHERATQAQMAKQLLLMHIGKLVIMKDGSAKPADVPMASVLAHCSRTFINTPCYETASHNYYNKENLTPEEIARKDAIYKEEFLREEREMWDAILLNQVVENGEVKYKNLSDTKYRFSSTHSFERRKVGQKFGVEKKKKANLIGQTGMNVAIGGMGTAGVGNEMIDIDGSCGHVYAMHKESASGEAGGYLFGYESDSFAHTNQLGHTHDIFATGEKASSFGCQRVDEIGQKLAGRQADITRLKPSLIKKWMNIIDKAFFELDKENLDKVMNMLTGNQIEGAAVDEFVNCFRGLTTSRELIGLKGAFTQNRANI